MQPIEPAGPNPSYQSQLSDRAAVPPSTAQTSNSQQTSSSQSVSMSSTMSQTTVSQTTMSQTTMVQQQVGSMLESISPELAQGNQYLKLLIAALILNALLNGDESTNQSGQNGQGAMSALENLAGGKNNSFFLAIETSTNTVQIQQMSSRLESAQAVQSLSQYQSNEGQSGSKMDVAG